MDLGQFQNQTAFFSFLLHSLFSGLRILTPKTGESAGGSGMKNVGRSTQLGCRVLLSLGPSPNLRCFWKSKAFSLKKIFQSVVPFVAVKAVSLARTTHHRDCLATSGGSIDCLDLRVKVLDVAHLALPLAVCPSGLIGSGSGWEGSKLAKTKVRSKRSTFPSGQGGFSSSGQGPVRSALESQAS